VLVRRRIATPDGGVLPDEGVTVRNVLEVLVEWLAGMAREHMGPKWRTYFPLVGTMFLLHPDLEPDGQCPGLAGATSDANTTWAWAIIAWVFYTAIGIIEHKHRHLS
jgi:F-type H+-transporting ATPase subunit a